MRQALLPKNDFIKDKARASAFADAVAAPTFRDGVKAALSAYTLALPLVTQPGASALRLAGAKEFVDVLLNIGEQTEPIIAPSKDELGIPEELLNKAFDLHAKNPKKE